MSTEATASTATIILLSACSFVGNIGAAVTGFGQAIIYLLVWQIVELAGYDGNFKYAVFIQALSLFSMQVRAYVGYVLMDDIMYAFLVAIDIATHIFHTISCPTFGDVMMFHSKPKRTATPSLQSKCNQTCLPLHPFTIRSCHPDIYSTWPTSQ